MVHTQGIKLSYEHNTVNFRDRPTHPPN